MNTCYNPFSLAGKTILVTGASSGIGRATAIECAKMGASLIITGRNEARLQETFDHLCNQDSHKAIVADINDEESLGALVSEIDKIDGAVLCAGISTLATLKFAKKDKFDKVFDTNFFSQIEIIRLLYKGKKFNVGSSIVLLSSIGGNYKCTPAHIIYGTSKAALSSATRFMADELAPKVRVNCLCPGMIETPLIQGGSLTEEQLQMDMAQYPMKRYGKPEEVAYGAIYLLSDASSWVTGQDLVIDGGLTCR